MDDFFVGQVLYLHGAGGAFGDDDVGAAVCDGAGQMPPDGLGEVVIFLLHAGRSRQTAAAAVDIHHGKTSLPEQVDTDTR